MARLLAIAPGVPTNASAASAAAAVATSAEPHQVLVSDLFSFLVQLGSYYARSAVPGVNAGVAGSLTMPVVLNWSGFGEVLSRIWHGTHAVRRVVGATRER